MHAPISTAVVVASLAGTIAATNAQAASRIFFERAGDIHVSAPSGTKAKRVVSNAEGPAVSLDGRRLAYTAKGDVWTASTAGANDRRLRIPGEQSDPAWSPSGRRLVFVTDGQLETMRRDGSKRRFLTDGRNDSQPDWSPDASEIVFTRAGTTDESFDVLAVGARGGDPRPIVASPCAEFNPSWSPDGERVALFVGLGVTECREGIAPGVHVVGADGSGDRMVAQSTGETGLDWSPDGSRIVAGSYFEDLITFASGGGGTTAVAATTNAYSPTWAPAR